ncbi:MAG: terminase large subunit, partial [Salinivirgaceae bacterium]|nr:terminase large subunit [Salinivirgaceae bacterium]
IKEYYHEIVSGRIVVRKKIKKLYDRLVNYIDHPEENYITDYRDQNEYYEFNPVLAERPIEFIESFCKHVKGSGFAGQFIKLELWQKALISAFYGFVSKNTGYRKYQRLHLYVARKNGKTLLAACLIIYELIMGGEIGAEIYSGATKRDQAKITWDMAKLIIAKSPSLNKKFRSTIHGVYLKPFSDSFYKPISKESKKLDGLNGQMIHIDELHAIVDSNVIDVMWDSCKTRNQPIELITTTMGTERESTFDEIYEYDEKVIEGEWTDDRLLAFCYEIDDANEWNKIKSAYKANPNLGVSLSVNGLYEEIEKCKNDATKLTNLLCKSFNVRQSSRHSWLTYDQFNNTEVVDLIELHKDDDDPIVIGGFDLSRTGDLTAFTTLHFDKKRKKVIAETVYWVTQEYCDSHPKMPPIQKWVNQGYVRISGKDIIDYHDIVNYVKSNVAKGYMYQFIGYDPYSASYLVNELESEGFAKKYCLIKVRQGSKTLSVPMQFLESDVKEKNIIYQNNPVTKWCFSNVELEKDRNGNYLPKKGSYDRKIDGVATILDCYVPYLDNINRIWEED